MSQTHIAHDGKGYRVYRTELGTDRTYVGPSWPTPKEAAQYAALIEVPYIPPLRASAEDASREHRVSLTRFTVEASSAELPRGSSRRSGTRRP